MKPAQQISTEVKLPAAEIPTIGVGLDGVMNSNIIDPESQPLRPVSLLRSEKGVDLRCGVIVNFCVVFGSRTY
jgi:hypothetical protein